MASRGNSISRTLVWILLALLIVGLAGFGAVNLSGNVRSVGAVGDKEIGVDQYARALQQEMRAIEAQTGQPLSFAQAQAFGVQQSVLSQLITQRALDHETDVLGLSIGDENLHGKLLEIQAFRGADGKFDREAYRFALQNAGLTDTEFETRLREEEARTIVQDAVLSGTLMPQTWTDVMIGWFGERRSFAWAALDEGRLETPLRVPDEAELRAWYDDNIAQFTLPETRRITYAWLTPEMIVDSVEIDEAALREQYEARSAEFNQPERRLVERLAFEDEESAASAKARIEAGGAEFETLVEDRGLALSDVDLGDLTRDDLAGAGEAIFAAPVGQVVGPLPSPLGPALFRVNGILPAQEIPFDEAQEALRAELALDRARRVIESKAEGFDDMLAGGATLEDLAKDTEMEIGRIDWHPGIASGIAAYSDFAPAASALTTGDFPAIAQFDDGAVYAMRLDEIVPPTPQPFDEVQDEVRAAWQAAETTARLRARGETLAEGLREGGDMSALGLEVQNATSRLRSDRVEGLPPALLAAAFEMEEGDVRVVEGSAGEVYLVQLLAVMPPDADDPQIAAARDQLAEQAAGAVAQDLFNVYVRDIRSRAGVTLDQQALNAVQAQFQ